MRIITVIVKAVKCRNCLQYKIICLFCFSKCIFLHKKALKKWVCSLSHWNGCSTHARPVSGTVTLTWKQTEKGEAATVQDVGEYQLAVGAEQPSNWTKQINTAYLCPTLFLLFSEDSTSRLMERFKSVWEPVLKMSRFRFFNRWFCLDQTLGQPLLNFSPSGRGLDLPAL